MFEDVLIDELYAFESMWSGYLTRINFAKT